MKKTVLSVIVLVAIVSLASCTKESANCDLIAAKIIRFDCDRVIFQLLTTESIGDADWHDLQSGNRYSNVVSYYNTCAIAALTNGNYDTLYVSLKKTNETLYDRNCFQCQAMSDNPPQTKVDFTEISQSACAIEPKGN